MQNAFYMLHQDVQALAAERFGRPTPVQQAVIPALLNNNGLSGKGLLVIAETGSGKTEACMLPLFSRLAEKEHRPISLLYITPLRSLNRDLMKRLVWWCERLDISISVRHGDTSQYERSMQAANPAEIMILTPETLQAILVGRRMREHLKNVRHIVIDEIHELVGSKRGSQLAVGLERLRAVINEKGAPDAGDKGKEEPDTRHKNADEEEINKADIEKNETAKGENKNSEPFQIIGLSATVGNPEEVMAYLHAGSILNAFSAKSMQIMVEYPRENAIDYIAKKIGESKSMLIFSNTRETAEVLSSKLKRENLEVETHHSSLSKEVRVKAEDEFKSGKVKAIVCTSSLELGIDIGSVDMVLQYGSPRQVSKLLQRAGRSGHSSGRTSKGLIIALDADDALEAAAIASHAMKGLIEKASIYEKPLDVLAHQLAGMALDKYGIRLSEAYSIAKRAYPFRNIEMQELFDVAKAMERLGFFWILESEDGKPENFSIRRRSKAFEYYNENLSTIPVTKTYSMIDVTSRQHVATLDADFVSMSLYPSAAFISKGQGWKVISIDNGKVFAEPLDDTQAAVPAWQGEMIPVPKEIANEVGKIRRKVREMLESGTGNSKAAAAEYLVSNYPVSKSAAELIAEYISKQPPDALATDRKIVIEHGIVEKEAFMIIHSCNGSKANETFGRALASLALGRTSSLGLETDPCRIIFRLKRRSDRFHMMDMLEGMSKPMVLKAIQLGLADSELLAWRFSHVARRFGIIAKDADYGKVYLKKAVKAYVHHPAYLEALNEVIQEKLDIQAAEELAEGLRDGTLHTSKHDSLTPIGLAGIAKRYEIIASALPSEEILRIFRERLHKTMLALVCCNCARIAAIGSVKELLSRDLSCNNCRSKMLGITSVQRSSQIRSAVEKNLSNRKLSAEEQKELDRLMDSAALLVASGHQALKVLAAKGIGTKTAARILAKRNTEDKLYEDILKAERQYIRTRGFWRE
ncbi:MAG: DEAD/DEAH box helicase [Candidatus Aenigmarchaeota archaeon]|nr:DEAD/DEAH box helicase [Candidatus Aenigmarchaeota archaeon]